MTKSGFVVDAGRSRRGQVIQPDSKCVVSKDGKHDLRPARVRGRKHRDQCRHCLGMTGWIKPVNVEPVEPARDWRGFWNSSTVADCRAEAKERGIRGYSKMTKAQLVEALGGEGRTTGL